MAESQALSFDKIAMEAEKGRLRKLAESANRPHEDEPAAGDGFSRLLSAPSVPTQDQILERKASWRKGMLAMQSCPVLQKPTITGEDDRVQSVRSQIATRLQPAPPPKRLSRGRGAAKTSRDGPAEAESILSSGGMGVLSELCEGKPAPEPADGPGGLSEGLFSIVEGLSTEARQDMAKHKFLQWACEKLSIDPSRLRKGVGADVLSSEEEEVPGEEELSVQQMLGEMRVPSGA